MKAVIQEWEESERGWGVRPDGCSLHRSMESHKVFVEDFWKRQREQDNGGVPDEYSREASKPWVIDLVEPELIQLIEEKGDFWLFEASDDFRKLKSRLKNENNWHGK